MSWSVAGHCWISVCGLMMIGHWKVGWNDFLFIVWDVHWSRYVIISRRPWSWSYWCWKCWELFYWWLGHMNWCQFHWCRLWKIFVFWIVRDDAAVSKIVARFLSSGRWYELAAVVKNGEGSLRSFTNSLAATNILVVGDNVGVATSVGKNWAAAQILVPPVDKTKHL